MTTTHTTAKGMLFDMDGTLLDSTPAVNATWDYFAREYDLDLHEVLKTSHGTRTIDNLRKWCGLSEQAELEAATEQFESMIVSEAQRLKSEGKTGLEILPGVLDILGELDKASTPVWAIITSATLLYASDALPTAGVPKPPKLITANDVTKGKPHPEPYLTGAKILGYDIKDCIVIEDAPSGIRSGVASGARVLAVCTSHTRAKVTGLGATWIVEDLSKVKASLRDGLVHLDIDES
ncbi:HAD-like domain-containing protein [Naematelia encephala]|uniref:HAD-like domain-containing protein n=1 Tax=Naematelia encephala TaxID=71784 RepID=A0A1Y2AM31_9TREE|nr:HAD-like domain-containing protein [Naematelia encephala]